MYWFPAESAIGTTKAMVESVNFNSLMLAASSPQAKVAEPVIATPVVISLPTDKPLPRHF